MSRGDRKSYGQWLRAAREARGWSQREMAARTGLPKMTGDLISKIERDEPKYSPPKPDIDAALRVALQTRQAPDPAAMLALQAIVARLKVQVDAVFATAVAELGAVALDDPEASPPD